MRKVVVLPAPLGPSRPKISPRFTSKVVSATATKLPNVRERSRARIGTSPVSSRPGSSGSGAADEAASSARTVSIVKVRSA